MPTRARPATRSLIAAGLALASFSSAVAAGDSVPSWWPRFRGPAGSGVAPGGDFPVEFGPEKNVRWQVGLPPGHSSPVVWGERIWVTAFAEEQLETVCLDRSSGAVRWRRRLPHGPIEQGSRLGNPATSTPVADAGGVCVYFGSFGLAAWDDEGRERWRRPLPTPITGHGASTSPVLAGDRLILACDQDVGSYLLCVDRRTGKTLWRRKRPGYRRGFSTPLPWPPDAPRQVLLSGTLRLTAYSLERGEEAWSVRGLPNEIVSSPIAGDGLVYAAGWTYGSGVDEMPRFGDLLERGDEDHDGELTREEAPGGPARRHFPYIDADKNGRIDREEWDSMARIFDAAENALLAVRPGGEGDVTAAGVVWKATRGLPYVPTPLCYQGRVFIVRRGGIASSFDARTGKPHFDQQRLGAIGNYYASPVAAGGKILVASQQGVAVVIRSADELEVLARNELGEPVMATPAIVGDTLYLRTTRRLFAFREGGAGTISR